MLCLADKQLKQSNLASAVRLKSPRLAKSKTSTLKTNPAATSTLNQYQARLQRDTSSGR